MPQEVLAGEMEIVSALCRGLAARIGQDRYELWFGSQVDWEFTGDILFVTARSSFVLDRLRRQFHSDIQIAARLICGESVTVEYRVGEGDQSFATGPLTSTATFTPGMASSEKPRFVPRVESSPMKPSEPIPRRRAVQLSTFVVGTGNRVAYTATQSLFERLGKASPLFLYGPPGSGKTHLLEGICTAARSGTRGTRALFLSADQFTSNFLEALQGSGLPNFRRKCREVDVLAIDDIQFFGGKRATTLEFQHTLDALARQGRQVVLAADRAPAELAPLGAELVTRLAGGLVCGLELADYETRLVLTRQFAERNGLRFPDEVIRMIAAETTGDARQIQGAINRLRATSEALNEPITIELATRSLQDLFSSSRRMIHLPDVERAVCEVFGMESHALRDGSKTKSASQPRMLAMWLARKYTRAAFSEIGEYFGRRSHSTVISAERKVDRWVADRAKLKLGRASWLVEEALRRIESKLRTG
jgi:chromosomal replication initiator protein